MLAGKGFVYNEGEKVEGTTNFLWVLFLGAFSLLSGLDIETSALVLAFLLSSITVLISYYVSCQIFERVFPERANSNFKYFAAFFAIIILFGNANFLILSLSGLEVPLIHFFLALFLFLSIKNEKLFSRLVLFLLSLTRPEFVALLALNEIIEKDYTVRIRGLIFCTFAFFLIFGGRLLYFGDFFPNTFYAKTNAETSFSLGLREFLAFLKSGGWLCVFILIALLFQKEQLERKIFVFSLFYFLYIIILGRNSLGYFRFYIHLLPLISPFLILLFKFFYKFIPISLMIFIFLLSPISFHFFTDLGNPRESVNFMNFCWKKIGTWLNENTKKETTIALNPIGQIGFFSKRPILDMLGLIDRTIAKSPRTQSKTRIIGHEKSNSEYVLGRKPDIIILRGALFYPKPLTIKEMAGSDSPFRGDNELFRHPIFQKEYQLINIKMENLFFPFFLRKNSRDLVQLSNSETPIFESFTENSTNSQLLR
ncbi:MAG: hypothetical protein HQM08_02465 [Candidatus Riflebacteria bacterium]|nr:hypothetical protein [Candidatus Riflebacteria bacterium]